MCLKPGIRASMLKPGDAQRCESDGRRRFEQASEALGPDNVANNGEHRDKQTAGEKPNDILGHVVRPPAAMSQRVLPGYPVKRRTVRSRTIPMAKPATTSETQCARIAIRVADKPSAAPQIGILYRGDKTVAAEANAPIWSA